MVAMKRHWTSDELLQHFTLHSDELTLLTSTTDHNRLGFAVLLKYFQYEGCFPQNPVSIPRELTCYLAKQINVPNEAFARYDFGGRSIREHRARIREWLGFRSYVEADRPALIDWLCKKVVPENQKMEFLVDAVRKHLQAQKIEPPTRASIERIIGSAIHTYETRLFKSVCDQLPVATRLALDELLKPRQTSTQECVANTPLHQIRTCKVKASLANSGDTQAKFATHCWQLFACVALPRLLMTWLSVWYKSFTRSVPKQNERFIKKYSKTLSGLAAKRTYSFKSQKWHFLGPTRVLRRSSFPSLVSRHYGIW
jgi:hypothetical protein